MQRAAYGRLFRLLLVQLRLGALLARPVDAQRRDIVGFDSVSSVGFPYAATFKSSSTGVEKIIADVSAMAFASAGEALLLADRSHFYTVQLSFSDRRLVGVTFLEDVPLNASTQLDSEGLVILDGDVYVSTETPPEIYRCPLLQDRPGTGPCEKAFDTADFEGAGENEGFEPLCMTSTSELLITATESPLERDGPGALRLTSFSVENGTLVRQVLYNLEENDPVLLIVELLALDDLGLDGGRLLAMERGWNFRKGNEIRLYVVDTAGATDVSGCRVLSSPGRCNSTGDDVVPAAKRGILRWTVQEPLDGLVVDNYEGMAFVPEVATGPDDSGIWIMMVNDNNGNKYQIGTQFVMLRLVLGAPSEQPAEERRRRRSLKVLFGMLFFLGMAVVCAWAKAACAARVAAKEEAKSVSDTEEDLDDEDV